MKIPVKRFEIKIRYNKFEEVVDGYFTISKIKHEEVYLNFINQGYLPRPY